MFFTSKYYEFLHVKFSSDSMNYVLIYTGGAVNITLCQQVPALNTNMCLIKYPCWSVGLD